MASISQKIGLLRPFGRDLKNNFASGSGEALRQSKIGQILGTEAQSEFTPGELAWDPAFGSRLHIARHKNNNATLQHLIRAFVIDALQRYMPSIRVTQVSYQKQKTERSGDTLAVFVHYDEVDPNTGNVLATGLEAQVALL